MIQDNVASVACTVPAANEYISSSLGIDLNPDFGAGASARKSPLPGNGHDIIMRIDVGTSFTQSAAGAYCLIHAAISTAGGGATLIHTGDPIALSTLAPQTLLLDAGPPTVFGHGFPAAQLVSGYHFFMKLNPWTAGLGRGFGGTTVIGKNYRYLGIMITVPSSKGDGSGPYMSAGSLVGRIVTQGDIFDQPEDFLYPPAVVMKG